MGVFTGLQNTAKMLSLTDQPKVGNVTEQKLSRDHILETLTSDVKGKIVASQFESDLKFQMLVHVTGSFITFLSNEYVDSPDSKDEMVEDILCEIANILFNGCIAALPDHMSKVSSASIPQVIDRDKAASLIAPEERLLKADFSFGNNNGQLALLVPDKF